MFLSTRRVGGKAWSARTPMRMSAYATLEQVQVPPDTAAGGEFTVSIQAKRKGQTVAVAKQLWRASGKMPIVQPRKVQETTEPRHSLRPSALERLRMDDSRAQPVDGDQSRPAGARRWVGELELPFGQCRCSRVLHGLGLRTLSSPWA